MSSCSILGFILIVQCLAQFVYGKAFKLCSKYRIITAIYALFKMFITKICKRYVHVCEAIFTISCNGEIVLSPIYSCGTEMQR